MWIFFKLFLCVIKRGGNSVKNGVEKIGNFETL